jgi:methylglutaconyl-CoA hydratase
MNFKTIEIEIKEQVGTIWFNRPQIHNAFNEEMIEEIIQAIEFVNANDEIRVLVLRGRGKSFCAGADLNWMRGVSNYTYNQNYAESLRLSECFYAIYTCKKPTIAMVHGAAIGGANGFLAACDFALAEENTVFSLSEVKIGIVPACISPYVIKRVGEYNARELMLTGKRITGRTARKRGLLNKSLPSYKFEDELKNLISLLKSSGPQAMSQCKTLIFDISNKLTLNDAITYTAEMIAQIRASEEGQEGMAAFLEKRTPNWIV